MAALKSRVSVRTLVHTTGARISSDEHMAKKLVFDMGESRSTIILSEKSAWRWRVVSFSSSFTAKGSSVDNISLWEDNGFIYSRKEAALKSCGMEKIPDAILKRAGNVIMSFFIVL